MKLNVFLILLFFLSLASKSDDKKIDFIFEQELRLREYNYYQHTDLTIEYPINKHFITFVGYRFLYEVYDDSEKDDFYWNRFHTGVHYILKEPWGKLALRSRFEYTPGESMWTSVDYDIDDDFRFRERVKYNLPFKFTKFDINPYMFGELFFDIDGGDGLNRTRHGAGIDSKLTKRASLSVYYFLENKWLKNRWNDDNVLALTFKYKLN